MPPISPYHTHQQAPSHPPNPPPGSQPSMLSYIVGLVAVGLLLANPLSQLFFSDGSSTTLHRRQQTTKLSPRPQLNESLLALDGPGDAPPECPPDAYVARILRREPLVVYLEGFLSEEERNHLLEISEPIFEPATITNDARSSHHDSTVRDSSVALIPRTDTVRCIEARALALQGRRRDVFLERLRTQRYGAPRGHYRHHYDWSANVAGWGRVSSFMAWVGASADLRGGGTEFPLLERRGEWCAFVECPPPRGEGEGEEEEEEEEATTVFTPRPGNAVFWENFDADGRGYEETWHAGLPVTQGVKVGLNIWSFGRIEG